MVRENHTNQEGELDRYENSSLVYTYELQRERENATLVHGQQLQFCVRNAKSIEMELLTK